MKWIPLIALAITPCWAGTLRGVVTNAKGHHIASAGVTIFNELVPIFVQVGKTDANGSYHFKVGAGIYRVIIIKKDYIPLRERVTMEGHKIVKNLNHQLIDVKDGDENHYARILKSIYRQSNREPYRRDMDDGLSIAVTQNAPIDDGFIASLTSQSRSALNGQRDVTDLVQIGTQFGDGLTFDSRFARQYSAVSEIETQRIQAGFSLNRRNRNMDLQAETIRNVNTSINGQTHRLTLAGKYGNRIRSETALDYKQSTLLTDRHQEISINQDLSYRLGLLPLKQSLQLTQWRHNQTGIGQKADFHTDITIGPTGRWSLASDFQHLNLNEKDYQQTTLWFISKQRSKDWPIIIENNIGWLYHRNGDLWVQDHLVQAATDFFEITAQHKENQYLNPLSSLDIFGQYISQPATPYALESFLQNRQTESVLQVGLAHAPGWRSQVAWKRTKDRALLIQPQDLSGFKTKEEQEQEVWSYRLNAFQWGSQLEISHRQHQSTLAQFQNLVVSYSQWVRPFRDKTRGLMFALQMGNQPNIPGWWLLEEMPWNPSVSGNWYEGQLRVQF